MSDINAPSLLNQQRANVTFLKQSIQQEAQAATLVEQAVQSVEEPEKAPAGNGRLVDIVI
jgi:hypothetical protein